MNKQGMAAISLLTAALITASGCAGQAVEQTAPMIQSSQVMLPGPDQIPRNEALTLANDDGSAIIKNLSVATSAVGAIRVGMALATGKDPVAAMTGKDTAAEKTPAKTSGKTQQTPAPPANVPAQTPAINTPSGNTAEAPLPDVAPTPSLPEENTSNSGSGSAGNGSSSGSTSQSGSTGENSTSGSSTSGGSSQGNSSSGSSDSGNNTAETIKDPLTVLSGGQTITGDAVEIVSRVVQNEVGSGFEAESTKALAVAVYSYIKYYNDYLHAPASFILSSSPSTRVTNLVKEVTGQAVRYNGRYCACVFFAISAGCTTSAQNVWGSSGYPYLVSVDSSVDTAYSNGWSSYRSTAVFSAADIAEKMNTALGTSLDPSTSDPAGWIEVLSHTDGKYVGSVRVGSTTTTGRKIREKILGLRSHAFEVSYDATSGNFVFTVYGYGHGVGLSQVGANYYAKQGWSYRQILTHYYVGTSVG